VSNTLLYDTLAGNIHKLQCMLKTLCFVTIDINTFSMDVTLCLLKGSEKGLRTSHVSNVDEYKTMSLTARLQTKQFHYRREKEHMMAAIYTADCTNAL